MAVQNDERPMLQVLSVKRYWSTWKFFTVAC